MNAKHKTYDQLLSEYLDLLDESTGYNFSNRELIAHTYEWDYKELLWHLTALTYRMNKGVMGG